MESIYLCIDLKTFYASVECVERNLDPFTTNLIVADASRGKGSICLAISPALKDQGIRNRCRVYEIPTTISYITAMPRMQLYIDYASNVYEVYLKYVAKEDIHVYSIDEAFLDITHYLSLYNMTPKQLAKTIIDDVLVSTKITASVGIGTNLYLAKIALDLLAKNQEDHMACLTPTLFQQKLGTHQPLSDFWHIGKGIQRQLHNLGIYDMNTLASFNKDAMFRQFGINAEYMIDHANGIEPTTIQDIKNYKSKAFSMNSSQILFEDYQYSDALLVVKEMVELKTLDLVDQHLVTNHISLSIGYSKNCISSTGGSLKLQTYTNSYRLLVEQIIYLYKRTTNKQYPIRSIAIGFGNLVDQQFQSYTLFCDLDTLEKEQKIQQTILSIKQKYGKNSILKTMNLCDKATTTKRNKLIGGHNANTENESKSRKTIPRL